MSKFKQFLLVLTLAALLVGAQLTMSNRIPLVTSDCDEQATAPVTLADFVPDCWLIQ